MPSGENGPVRGTTTPILIGPDELSVPPSAGPHAARPRARASAPATVGTVSFVLNMGHLKGLSESGSYQGSCLSGSLKMEYDHGHTGVNSQF